MLILVQACPPLQLVYTSNTSCFFTLSQIDFNSVYYASLHACTLPDYIFSPVTFTLKTWIIPRPFAAIVSWTQILAAHRKFNAKCVDRFLQTAEMLKPSTPSASHDSTGSSGNDDGAEYYPHIGDSFFFNAETHNLAHQPGLLISKLKCLLCKFPPLLQCSSRIRPGGMISAQGIWRTCIWSWTN